MAEKNTQGAVHLTSLSLDLTEIQQNINTIETEMASLADSAVQYGEKIRNSLNMPSEQMTLSVDTTQLTQNLDTAQASVERLGNTFRTVTKNIQGGQLFTADSSSIDNLAKQLGLTEEASKTAKIRLTEFFDKVKDYNKIQFSTSGGKLFQAIVTSSDEAGQSIRKVIDLTKKVTEETVNSAVTITDNAEKRNAAIEKANNALANSLNKVISQYEKLAEQVRKSDLNDFVKEGFITRLTTSQNEVKGLQNQIRELNYIASESNLAPRFEQFSTTLSKIDSDFSNATQAQREFLQDANKQVTKITSQYEKLSNNIAKSNLDDLVKEELINRVRVAQESIQKLTQDISAASSFAQKGDFSKEFISLSGELENITRSFDKATEEQAEFLAGGKRVVDLSKSYASLQNRLAGVIYSMTTSGIDTSEMSSAIFDAKSLANEISKVSDSFRDVDYVTEDAIKKFKDYDNVVSELNLSFKNIKIANAEYENSLKPIIATAKNTIASLKTLEKAAVFRTSKNQVAELRAEYEEFLNKLKNTNIATDAAQNELNELNTKFTQLESTVKHGNGTLENWVNKISESAKWQIANSALNLIQNSFSQLTGTIIETEDAVIELQRVLNEKDLSGDAISGELYDIAYEFGQTFDAVQETAIKFAQTGLSWQEVVEATRATMLGLNTAELEVSTATEGLIAVMAQFGLEASDLEEVIDKINITADNFPVTSEKIVAALQRAGGTANAFGLSLEETIGIITALGEATGRAGEAIGTAMNSLISFSMKDTALAKFSEFLGKDVSDYGVLELWQELGAAINDSGASLAAMMSTSEEFNDLFDEGLATAVGLEDEFSKATEETNQMLKDGKDIYSTVGTYRQNYFIALLNNIATAIEAIGNMGDAIGYSMQENETAMEAFSKKWNQLVIAAKELAVQFGEAGFLDLMKWAVEATGSILQLTKSFGGLRTAVAATATIFFTVKKAKIDDHFKNIKTALTAVKTAQTAYNAATAAGATTTTALAAAIKALKLSAGGIAIIIGLIATAISAVIGKMQAAKEEAEQLRQEAISAGQEAVQRSKDLYEAYSEYDKARTTGTYSDREAAAQNMIQQLGYEISDIEILTERYGSLEKAIESLMDAEYERNKAAAKAAYEAKASAEEFQKVQRQSIEASKEDKDVLEELYKAGYDYSNLITALNRTGRDVTYAFDIPDFASANTQLKDYNKMLEVMDDYLTSDEKANSKLYQSVLKARDALETYIKEVEYLKEKYEQYGMSREEYDRNMAEAAEKFKNAIAGTETTVEETVMSLEEMDEAIDNLNKKMDSFQSSVNSIKKVIEEYNETGVMTADMLQTLMSLSPEYIDLIDANSGALSINQEKLESLMVVNDNYMVQMAAMKVARETETLVTKLQTDEYNNLTVAEITAKLATEALGGEVYTTAMKFYTGQINAEQFGRKIEEFGRKAGLSAEKLEVLRASVVGLTDDLSGFISLAGMSANFGIANLINGKTIEQWADELNAGHITPGEYQKYWSKYQNKQFDKIASAQTPIKSSGTKTWFPPTSTSSKSKSSKETDPYKEEKEALDDLLDAYEHSIFLIEKNEKTSQDSADKIVVIYRKMQEEIHNTADDYRQKMNVKDDEYTRGLSEKWWQIQETIEEVLQGVYEETVRSYNSALNLLEHQYETAEENMDYSYMGENLKKQLDYQVKIQREAERELERLAELGMDANDDAAQDVIDTWYEAEKAIREISQKIADDVLEPYDDFIDLADQFELWDYMDFTKVDYLRDKLEAVNKLLEDGTITLKEYNEQLKDVSYAIYEAQKELYEKEKESISERYDALVDAYKADQESLKNQKDQVNDYYDAVIDGYNKEIEAWEKRKEEVEDYYDGLIENLNEVQEANERINAQVDYYNERQKIITNLEQAQSRSGVEWREKEMEYQQQLMDLDEDWRRTQEEWSIEDQIEAIEKLKEIAIQDIELSIAKIRDTITAAEEAKQAALDSIDAQIESIEKMIEATEEAATQEIEAINNKIQEMSEFIANAIKDGTVDGLVDSKEEFNKALVDGTNAMLDYIDKGNLAITDSATQTANNVYGIYDADFMTPMNNSIIEIANNMSSAITTGASDGAKQALNVFQSSFIEPLKKEMASLMKQTQTAKETVSSTSTSKKTTTSSVKKLTTAQAAAFTSGAGPVDSSTPLIPKIDGFDIIKSKFTPQVVNHLYINNNYRAISEGVRDTQNIIANLGSNSSR